MNKRQKAKIPSGALDSWAADVHRVRLAATKPRSPEEHRRIQEIEHQRRQQAAKED